MSAHADRLKQLARTARTPEEIYRALLSVVAADPDDCEAWMQLGMCATAAKLRPAAVAHYRRVVESPRATDEDRGRAYCNLGQQLFHLGQVDAAERATREALKIDAHMAYAWTNMSMVQTLRGDTKKGVAAAMRGFTLEPGPETELGLAFALLFDRQWIAGLQHFEARFPYRLSQYSNYPYPRWDGGKVGTLLIVDEQGLGDNLSFARFIPMAAARAERVIVAVPAELVRILSAMLPGILVIPTPHEFPDADAWCPPMSLPVALGLDDAGFEFAPGLEMPRLAPPIGWALPGRRFRIGVCWAGSPANDIDRWRTMPAEDFFALSGVPGVELYSLFVGPRVQDLHVAGGQGVIRDLSPWLRDVAATAALVAEMDLIITAETFLGHLAGAVGKECWVLASYHGWDWRIGRAGDGSIWYPKHRVFRQSADGRWGPVWDQVVDALRGRI